MKFDRQEAINRIISLIDESKDQWRKAGFYGDPDVQSILNSLYERWNKNNREGMPLNYATDEELSVLVKKAEEYSRMPVAAIQRQFLFGEQQVTEKKEGFLKKLKKIFSSK
ncbi:hypothetical protein J4526_05085 [Desulfurococcaceae archaeon MEX13E-LK6-19]|nr:hypothetical protein J4526_05085 [Desulfurococcaceae archaeon MEX13E-LK6-19]